MNKSYYFSHDYTAAQDTKVLFLRLKYGMEGYGIYWFIIEQLAVAGGNLPINILPVLAMQMHTTEDKVLNIIKDFDLFVIEDNRFNSKRLLTTITMRETLATKGKEGADKRWNKEPQQSKIILK